MSLGLKLRSFTCFYLFVGLTRIYLKGDINIICQHESVRAFVIHADPFSVGVAHHFVHFASWRQAYRICLLAHIGTHPDSLNIYGRIGDPHAVCKSSCLISEKKIIIVAPTLNITGTYLCPAFRLLDNGSSAVLVHQTETRSINTGLLADIHKLINIRHYKIRGKFFRFRLFSELYIQFKCGLVYHIRR